MSGEETAANISLGSKGLKRIQLRSSCKVIRQTVQSRIYMKFGCMEIEINTEKEESLKSEHFTLRVLNVLLKAMKLFRPP